MGDEQRQVIFIPLAVQFACPVPVTADGRTLDDNGEPLDLADRPERCAVWAHWVIGGQVSCDVHTAMACDLMGIDFDGLVIEAGRSVEAARVPWAERRRSTQADAEATELSTRPERAA